MTEKTKKICLEAIALLGKTNGITEVRVCCSVEKDPTIVTAALPLSMDFRDGKKVAVFMLGGTPSNLATAMLEYIKQYKGDPIAEEISSRHFAMALKHMECICKPEIEGLTNIENVGLVIVDGIHSLHLKEQGSFYESLMEYTDTTGIPAISIRQMHSAEYENGFAVGKVNRKLLDYMLGLTLNK